MKYDLSKLMKDALDKINKIKKESLKNTYRPITPREIQTVRTATIAVMRLTPQTMLILAGALALAAIISWMISKHYNNSIDSYNEAHGTNYKSVGEIAEAYEKGGLPKSQVEEIEGAVLEKAEELGYERGSSDGSNGGKLNDDGGFTIEDYDSEVNFIDKESNSIIYFPGVKPDTSHKPGPSLEEVLEVDPDPNSRGDDCGDDCVNLFAISYQYYGDIIVPSANTSQTTAIGNNLTRIPTLDFGSFWVVNNGNCDDGRSQLNNLKKKINEIDEAISNARKSNVTSISGDKIVDYSSIDPFEYELHRLRDIDKFAGETASFFSANAICKHAKKILGAEEGSKAFCVKVCVFSPNKITGTNKKISATYSDPKASEGAGLVSYDPEDDGATAINVKDANLSSDSICVSCLPSGRGKITSKNGNKIGSKKRVKPKIKVIK